MTPKRFTKNVENFQCLHCGRAVRGNGYTNHCPNCLWSRHTDINPGDRLENCKGLMKPIGLEQDHGENVILHRCEACGKVRKNKAAENDRLEVLL